MGNAKARIKELDPGITEPIPGKRWYVERWHSNEWQYLLPNGKWAERCFWTRRRIHGYYASREEAADKLNEVTG